MAVSAAAAAAGKSIRMSTMTTTTTGAAGGVFSDFCQAWVARFPGSELPAAWEEDVRANLKKHKTKVAILKEELEKEEMYVEYLDKLLADIEKHRSSKGPAAERSPEEAADLDREDHHPHDGDRHHEDVPQVVLDSTDDAVPPDSSTVVRPPEAFVTVINVAAAASQGHGGGAGSNRRNCFNARKPKVAEESNSPQISSSADEDEDPLAAAVAASVAATSSPSLSKKGLKSMANPSGNGKNNNNSSSISSSSTDSLRGGDEADRAGGQQAEVKVDDMEVSSAPNRQQHPLVAKRSLAPPEANVGPVATTSAAGTFEKRRGQPDGRDVEDESGNSSLGSCLGSHVPTAAAGPATQPGSSLSSTTSSTSTASSGSKIKELMANWENKQPIGPKPSSSTTTTVAAAIKPPRKKLDSSSSVASSTTLIDDEAAGGPRRLEGCPPDAAAAAVATGNKAAGLCHRKASRKDSDSGSSSRGRMGSPSGKSHDSSDDSETAAAEVVANSRKASNGNIGSGIRRSSNRGASSSGAASNRLDRLVRKPSTSTPSAAASGKRTGPKAGPLPALPATTTAAHNPSTVSQASQEAAAAATAGHLKKPKAKPRHSKQPEVSPHKAAASEAMTPFRVTTADNEPLYDTVANDDDDDGEDGEDHDDDDDQEFYYDNHLLCEASDDDDDDDGHEVDEEGRRIGGKGHRKIDHLKGHKVSSSTRKCSEESLSPDEAGGGSTAGLDPAPPPARGPAGGAAAGTAFLSRGLSVEDESNYVNIQYFLSHHHHHHHLKASSSVASHDDGGVHPGGLLGSAAAAARPGCSALAYQSDDDLDFVQYDIEEEDDEEAMMEDRPIETQDSRSRGLRSGTAATSSKSLALAASTSTSDSSSPASASSTLASARLHLSAASPPEVLSDQQQQQQAVPPGQTEAGRMLMHKCILNSILGSEAVYLEGLSVMLQYMKAMKVTLSTASPVIPKEEFDVIFFKIPELHDLHLTFYENLRRQVERWNSGGGPGAAADLSSSSSSVGHTFKMLACRTKIYSAYLNNYQKALDSLHRCTEAHPQFADLTRSIKLRSVQGQKQGQSLSLEDLLHKPVARLQKNCLCLQDLIKYTPVGHPDHQALTEALATMQGSVSNYNNLVQAAELFPSPERQQRHLVKNSFIVELSDGQRKLRHLFLFNDVLVCAKYKQGAAGKNEKFTFQLKWYIPLCHALIVEEPSTEPKESSPANLVALRTQTAALRDQIYRIDKEEELKGRRTSVQHSPSSMMALQPHSKASEKHRKKLAELGAQLVLASPTLVFQVAHKQGKVYTFFLSSEYERSQWVETLQVMQRSLPPNTTSQAKNISMYELQAWITSCRKFLKTNMGSFLMRSPRDEPLLVGDLIFKVSRLQGLTRPSDLYVVVEVDSYGHYFKKARTRTVLNAVEPVWDEEFVIELEGSENLRILVYELQQQQQPQQMLTEESEGASFDQHQHQQQVLQLRGRATLELSRTWLTGRSAEQRISMNDVVLECSIKFVAFEETVRRVPAAKATGLFGAPISATGKREKRSVPFIITSCVREVERRGLAEVGIYRVSGSSADVSRMKRAYESNPYEAEQLLKDCDIHSVAGTLKLYLRDLPESLFTHDTYTRMYEAYSTMRDPELRKNTYLNLFAQIPPNPNQACILFLIEHMVRVSQYEGLNKMSLHNLATVFGPTLLHAGCGHPDSSSSLGLGGPSKKTSSSLTTSSASSDSAAAMSSNQLTCSTVDVMAQAGILHFFLTRRARGEPIHVIKERQV